MRPNSPPSSIRYVLARWWFFTMPRTVQIFDGNKTVCVNQFAGGFGAENHGAGLDFSYWRESWTRAFSRPFDPFTLCESWRCKRCNFFSLFFRCRGWSICSFCGESRKVGQSKVDPHFPIFFGAGSGISISHWIDAKIFAVRVLEIVRFLGGPSKGR